MMMKSISSSGPESFFRRSDFLRCKNLITFDSEYQSRAVKIGGNEDEAV